MLHASRLMPYLITLLILSVVVSCGGGGGGSSGPTSPGTPPSPTPPVPPTPTPQPPTPPPAQPVATSIRITPASLTLTSLGQTAQLTATVNDQNNSPITGATVTWSSGNANVASVSAAGLVAAVSNGTARITARSGNVSNGITVTVSAPVPNRAPEAVGVIEDLRLVEGGPAEVLDVSGAFRDPEGEKLKYTAVSNDELVATVEVMEAQVTIRPVSAGRTTISVRAADPAGLSATQNFIATTVVSSDDRNALIAFYEKTGGPEWTDRTDWLSNAPLDAWHGVATDAGGRITRLELSGNNLQGPLPDELGQLGELTALNLAGNRLSGGIPPSIGRLTFLEMLNLEGNQLSGAIPPEIGHLGNLETLHLAGNQLSGNLPAAIEHLETLETLILGNNAFSGGIPPEIGQLQALIHLDLSINRLSGSLPAEIGRLRNLARLNVASNPELSGPLPLSFSGLNLESLHINGTQLCVPIAEVFQEWLGEISDLSEIVGCPDE